MVEENRMIQNNVSSDKVAAGLIKSILEQRDNTKRLARLLQGFLTPRQWNIINFRFGITQAKTLLQPEGKAHTLEQTGEMLSVTRYRIRQIQMGILTNIFRNFEQELRTLAGQRGIRDARKSIAKAHITTKKPMVAV